MMQCAAAGDGKRLEKTFSVEFAESKHQREQDRAKALKHNQMRKEQHQASKEEKQLRKQARGKGRTYAKAPRPRGGRHKTGEETPTSGSEVGDAKDAASPSESEEAAQQSGREG